MRELIAFTKKEAWHILRDKQTMLVVLLIPVVLMLLFGYAISTEVNNIEVAVVIPHRSESIRQLVSRLENNPAVELVGAISESEIDPTLRSGKAMAVVCFADDGAIQILTDASNTNTAAAVAATLQGLLSGGAALSMAPEVRLLYNPQMKSSYNFVPGIMGMIFLLICAMMTSVSIVREKEKGSMEVLLVSPVKPLNIMLAKLIPYFLLSCINLATILLLAKFVLGVPMTGSIIAIIGISLLYLALALALGLFISNVAQTQLVALIMSAMLLMLPVIMLSGMMFPIENMPRILRPLSALVPARWYIDAMRKLMIEGVPFRAVLGNTAILAGMTLLLIGLSLKKFNPKLFR